MKRRQFRLTLEPTADDAVRLDTSDMTVGEAVKSAIDIVTAAMARSGEPH